MRTDSPGRLQNLRYPLGPGRRATGLVVPTASRRAVEAIRALMGAKRSAAGERTQTINQARALVLTA